MAIVHIAMFDALDAVVGGYTSYTGIQAPHGPMSVDAAIAQAARDTLAALFPSQTATFDGYLAEDLAAIHNAHQKANGIDLGSARLQLFWRCVSMMVRKFLIRPLTIIPRTINPAAGGRIQSA